MFNAETYIKLIIKFKLIWVGSIVYLSAMVVAPVYQGNWDWVYIQNVWDRWQGLNVGMLAFIASIIALNISRYKAEQERKRNFIAAKAFLPEALSELTGYCNESMAVFAEVYSRSTDNTTLEISIPELPEGYRTVFQDCIRTAEPDVGDFLVDILAYILMRLQVHHSRMQALAQKGVIRPSAKDNIISYLYCIAEIQAKINRTFNYARGLEDFDRSPLVWEDYRNALSLGGINPKDYEGLQGFIERKIKRQT